ncbi:uncharacterized protein [Antedon mediterranea]|uniref:uncharacterized protein n=1 Tax=Antedon mediterranea TaxID=105859 RepID=UPI003AF43295
MASAMGENNRIHEKHQVRILKEKNERLALKYKEEKGRNIKWQQYDDEREEFVFTLTETCREAKSEVTVLKSFLRDQTRDLNEAKNRIHDLESTQAQDNDVRLINADLEIEKQREVIDKLEQDLCDAQEELSNLKKSCFKLSNTKDRLVKRVKELCDNLKVEKRKTKLNKDQYNRLLREKDQGTSSTMKGTKKRSSKYSQSKYPNKNNRESNNNNEECRLMIENIGLLYLLEYN